MPTIWCNVDLSEEPEALVALQAGTAGHRLILANEATTNLVSAGPSGTLEEADIAFGQPDPSQAMELPRLKWVHLTSAGYTRYDTKEFRTALSARGAILTNSSSVYDEPCAQHLLAFMLAIARALPESMAAQLGAPTWAFAELRPVTRLLRNQKVLILSYGAIARRLVALLAPFGLEIVAVRRTVKGDEDVPTYEIGKLVEFIPVADHIVNILPASPATDGLVDSAAFAAMKQGAIFYNVGRGSTVDQESLIASLETGHLRAAYLDVTDPEPLPSDHPLWKAPNCFITPHIAGGQGEEAMRLVEHFVGNLKLLEGGKALRDIVMS